MYGKMTINISVILMLISITMSGVTASLIISDINNGNDNAAHTQAIVNHKIDVISNQTRNDAVLLAQIQLQTAVHTHAILEQINNTVNQSHIR